MASHSGTYELASSPTVLASSPTVLADEPNRAWLSLVAQVLAITEAEVRAGAASTSFVRLGGTSLRAAEVVARARRDLLLHVAIADLLGDQPVSEVRATPVAPWADAAPAGPRTSLPVSAGQTSMLLADEIGVGTAFHLLFSAELRGLVDLRRMRDAISAVVARHPALRTVFGHGPDGINARVVSGAEPFIVLEDLPDLATAPVSAVADTIVTRTHQLLRPFERPPVVFLLTQLSHRRSLLSLLVHHAVADGWAIGLVLRELFEHYQDPDVSRAAPEIAAVTLAADESSAAVAELVEARANELGGFPLRLRLPQRPHPGEFDRRGSRLEFLLTEAEQVACEAIAQECGVTRNSVLFAAWTLTLSRFSGLTEFLVGLSFSGRATSEEMATVGLGTKLLPVTCTVPADTSCRTFVRATADQMRGALAFSAVPMEHLVRRLGLSGEVDRNPLVQVGFSAHDDLIPAKVVSGGLEVSIVEGHCGGTVFDAMLYVQRWGTAPRLALEYASTGVSPHTAGLLAAGLRQSLTAMAAALDASVGDISVVTSAQEQRLRALGAGPVVRTDIGLWQLIEAAAQRSPGASAVRDEQGAMTYGELVGAARRWSAALAGAGVRTGDCVGLIAARSIAEIIGILAILRLGAHYVSIEEGTPDSVVAQQWAIARPGAVLTEPRRAVDARRIAAGVTVLVMADPAGPADTAVDAVIPEPAEHDPQRPVYIAFTSGTTGGPKGVRVPDRAVVRLARDPGFLRDGATRHFVRLAPLAFDASTLEIFAPLAEGGCIEVYPHRPVAPGDLAQFIVDRQITGLWLTSGLFRVMADHHPDCFRSVGQLLTGGDVVPSHQVATVLAACPGLRVSNGYGPTENTTFTTMHHVDDVTDVEYPLPIGRPVPGGIVAVLDHLGGLAPEGAIGELYAAGDGLALDYADNPAETAARFVRRADGLRYYRTGDLVWWDARGRLRYVGRLDGQVKIRGYRVELEQIDRALRQHPAVADLLVTTFTDGLAERRILAAVIARQRPGLLDELREYAERELPRYAVPSRWLILDRIPLTTNGKPDHAALVATSTTEAHQETPGRGFSESSDVAGRGFSAEVDEVFDVVDLEDAISEAWQVVLGTDDFGLDERFFDVGGSSIQLPALKTQVQQRLSGYSVSVMDLLRHPTVEGLARHLSTRQLSPAQVGTGRKSSGPGEPS